MAAVCVGPEFTVDEDGRLRITGEGDRPDAAWPYPCSPGAANGLRRVPGGGLWVAPPPIVAQYTAQGTSGGPHVAVPAAVTQIDIAAIELTNPSTCVETLVLRWISVDVDLYLPAGSDAEAAVYANGNELYRMTNPAGDGGSEMTNHAEMVLPLLNSTLAPGMTDTFSVPIQVGSGDGGAMYGQCRWTVRALVMAVASL